MVSKLSNMLLHQNRRVILKTALARLYQNQLVCLCTSAKNRRLKLCMIHLGFFQQRPHCCPAGCRNSHFGVWGCAYSPTDEVKGVLGEVQEALSFIRQFVNLSWSFALHVPHTLNIAFFLCNARVSVVHSMFDLENSF